LPKLTKLNFLSVDFNGQTKGMKANLEKSPSSEPTPDTKYTFTTIFIVDNKLYTQYTKNTILFSSLVKKRDQKKELLKKAALI